MKILSLLAVMGIGWILGYAHAHYVVAAECERLGGFFVGKQVYKCHAIEKREDAE